LSTFTQVLAISDVHGMYDHLLTLLRGTHVIDSGGRWAAGRSLMVVCGDSIDKGPASIPTLELWMKLAPQAIAHGGRLVVLLGNHEAEFLKDPKHTAGSPLGLELASMGIRPDELANGTDRRGIGRFLRAMPIAARLGKFLFAHAGWYPTNTPWARFTGHAKTLLQQGRYDDPFITGEHSILEEKDEIPLGGDAPEKWYDNDSAVQSLELRLHAQNMYGVVFGHQPRAFGFKEKIGAVDGFRLIKIDTGMAPDASESAGEILRFKHSSDLLRAVPPDADRMLADGGFAKIKSKTAAADSR